MTQRLSLALALAAAAAWAQPVVGPPRGALLAAGGGKLGPEIVRAFIDLAGGPDAPVVVIPTAGEAKDYGPKYLAETFLREAGMKNLTLLHTRDRGTADSEEFVAPLRRARGVWFSGGRQWRLVDAYLGTRTQRALDALLARGGVIGGSSAGATIQGSYLVRGAREGNHIMMAKGYERGFGFLRGVAVDQHLIARKREKDLMSVVAAHPELLGIGIDEGTAVVVEGDRFRVVGAGKVAVYGDGKDYFFLSPGEVYDMAARKRR